MNSSLPRRMVNRFDGLVQQHNHGGQHTQAKENTSRKTHAKRTLQCLLVDDCLESEGLGGYLVPCGAIPDHDRPEGRGGRTALWL